MKDYINDTGVSILLKLNDELIKKIDDLLPPEELEKINKYENLNLTKLKKEDIHITLVSRSAYESCGFKEDPWDPKHEDAWNMSLDKYKSLKIVKLQKAYRPEEDKVSLVAIIEDQRAMRVFLSNLLEYEGYEFGDIDGNKVFHITVANNYGGDPFKSIGDVNDSDWKYTAKDEFLEFIEDKASIKACYISIDLEIEGETMTHYSPLAINYDEEEYYQFLKSIDVEYDSGYGSQELEGTIWFEDGTFAERWVYDGSEGWRHIVVPEIPKELSNEERWLKSF